LNTIEYANSESSSLFFYNPSRETVVYCQSRLHYCYKATNEEIERIRFIQHYKRKAVESKATIQPFATEEEAGSKQTRQLIRNERSNGSYKRGT
jgi:hypothetical protein